MKCSMIVLFALVAVATAAPQFFNYAPHGYAVGGYPFASRALPLAYSGAVASPLAYSAAPLAYSAAPVAYAAAPVAYTTGHRVEATYEPVEQHGYQIAY